MPDNNKKNILPVGFYDLIFDEAEKNHRRINSALDYFIDNNYRLIKTPLVEFEDSLNDQESENSFRFVDIISGKNLVLRSDITLQISRIFASILKDQELPLKICYSGDVLFTKNNELYADRQSSQVGLEIVGASSESHFEIIAMILQILPRIIDRNISIEFCVPEFAEILCVELGLGGNEELITAIKSKNLSLVRELSGQYSDLICEIMMKNNDLKKISNKILDLLDSDVISQKLSEMLHISEFVEANFDNIEAHFDLFGDDNSSYHKGLLFDVFCDDLSYPIVRGGRYLLNGVESVGATIYMNYLTKF